MSTMLSIHLRSYPHLDEPKYLVQLTSKAMGLKRVNVAA